LQFCVEREAALEGVRRSRDVSGFFLVVAEVREGDTFELQILVCSASVIAERYPAMAASL
jgi:hypothetical protein